mgnify:FL=1
MTIEQDGRVYTVLECEDYWSVKRPLGKKIMLEYRVPKEECKTLEDLNEYVQRPSKSWDNSFGWGGLW